MKAPSTIKTNIKAASSSHPYSRPWASHHNGLSTLLWKHLTVAQSWLLSQ